jgi:hypothetical protein
MVSEEYHHIQLMHDQMLLPIQHANQANHQH